MTDEGVTTKDIDMWEAVEQIQAGTIDLDPVGYEDYTFDKELYLDYLYENYCQSPEGKTRFKAFEDAFSNETASDIIYTMLEKELDKRIEQSEKQLMERL